MATRLLLSTHLSAVLAVVAGEMLSVQAGEIFVTGSAAMPMIHTNPNGEPRVHPDPVTPLQKLQLMRWASALSRRRVPVGVAPPELAPIPAAQLATHVCPDDTTRCRAVAAAYSVRTGVIYYRESFNLRRAVDRSYLVHELVHWLQHIDQGIRATGTCEMIVRNEREAYGVQVMYLQRHGSALANRVIPRSMACDPGHRRNPHGRPV